jgi:AraC-like DNA-binding protein
MAERTLPTPNDPLGDALHFLRMRGTLYCRSELTAPWALALPPLPGCLMFHMVTAGACDLRVAGSQPRRLDAGAIALVPHGQGHRLASAARAPVVRLFDAPTVRVSDTYEIVRFGGGGAPTTLLCGVMRTAHPAADDLLRVLPPVLVVDAWREPETAWLRTTWQLITAEAEAPRAGTDTVLARLADVLVVQVLRGWLERDPDARRGWLGALQDPQLGRALRAVHADPGGAWTVAALAREAGLSRSLFAARFTALVGEPAMRYVARWRMHVARHALRDDGVTVAAVAADLGYESEAAFSRAFHRITGEWPGAARRRGAARPGASTAG